MIRIHMQFISRRFSQMVRTCLPQAGIFADIFFGCFIILIFCKESSGQNISADSLKFPWAGGLNSCQVGEIDLNQDGIMDLVIFDRFGNRILPFIYNGPSGTFNYTYYPEYSGYFPDLHDWVQFRDYDHDGKNDIFTYSLGAMRVFRNVSDTVLKFQLITYQLTSFYYTGYVPILVTPVDFPAIEDIDGDGDLDILTFFGLGSYIEYHRNQSMEKYGNADSLDYLLADKCWGDIKESEGSNKITLNISCPYKYIPLPSSCNEGPPKHTGSTLLATDLNGDGLKDLILGDIDFPDLISLINGGTVDSAHMISQDTLFPSGNVPVNLFSFDAACEADIDHDGIQDLVISPFDPTYYISENSKSAWYYRNYGTSDFPDFRFISPNIFQGDMIDAGTASYPVLYDFRRTGLQDLFIGNYGYYDSSWYYQGVLYSSFTSRIAYYRNEGTVDAPRFRLVTADFANLSSQHLKGIYPAFGDLDNDGRTDLVIGNSDGKLLYLRNTGTNDDLVFAAPVADWQGIDVGDFSSPQLFDLDKDGLKDLVIGEQKGNLNYYRNTGTAGNPAFTFVTDSLGKINVTNYNLSYNGFSTPCLFLDATGRTGLLVGSEEGVVHYYTDIDGNLSGKFTESDSLWTLVSSDSFTIKCGWRTSPAIAHLGDPQKLDLLVGNFSGGVNYFSGKIQPQVYTDINDKIPSSQQHVIVYPNPADDSFSILLKDKTTPTLLHASLYDISGRVLLTQDVAPGNGNRISTKDIPNGLYFLRIEDRMPETGLNYYTEKVIILH